MSQTERDVIEAEVQKEKASMAKAAARKAPRAPRATAVKDKDGNVVMNPTAKQAAAAVKKAQTEQGLSPPPGAMHFAGKIRDARLGGAQADVEDADQAGVHPQQRERETEVGGIAVERLRGGIERIERLKEEQKALSADIADIFAEMKSAGFDGKIIRKMLIFRAMTPADREEEETLTDLYARALGL